MADMAMVLRVTLVLLLGLCLSIRARGRIVHASSNISVVEAAVEFTLYYGRNFKVVQDLFSKQTYLLLEEPEGFSGRDGILNLAVLQIPLLNYTIDTTWPVAFLEMLGLFPKLAGILPTYNLSSPCLLGLISQGLIPIANITNSNETSAVSALFTSLPPAIVSDQSNLVSFDPTSEQGPLQRAEWIKYLAAFFNLEARANFIYGEIVSNYQCLNASMNGTEARPLVAWLAYSEGVWTFSNATYKLQLDVDAGGLNLNSTVLSSSFNMSDESDVDSFYGVISVLDVVIDETNANDPTVYTLSNFTAAANVSDTAPYPFLSNGRLWRYDKRVGSNYSLDWFEGAIAQPQVVLRDLMEAFHPTGAYNATYFRNIALGENIVNTTTLRCRHNMTTAIQPTMIPCLKA